MSVLDFPDVIIASVNWRLVSRTQTFTSQLSGTTQAVELPGARWAAELAFPPLTTAEKKVLSAFLVRLRGRSGNFYLTEPRNKVSGSVLGTPTVNTGASNTPSVVGSSGWNASELGVLKAGDMINWGTDELKMVVADVDADSSGNALIQVEPPCRNQPSHGSLIITDEPKCIMRLADDNQAAWAATSASPYKITIKCEEVIVP